MPDFWILLVVVVGILAYVSGLFSALFFMMGAEKLKRHNTHPDNKDNQIGNT